MCDSYSLPHKNDLINQFFRKLQVFHKTWQVVVIWETQPENTLSVHLRFNYVVDSSSKVYVTPVITSTLAVLDGYQNVTKNNFGTQTKVSHLRLDNGY